MIKVDSETLGRGVQVDARLEGQVGIHVRDQSGPRNLGVKLEFLPCNTILIP